MESKTSVMERALSFNKLEVDNTALSLLKNLDDEL
jgi:hypothetical protein